MALSWSCTRWPICKCFQLGALKTRKQNISKDYIIDNRYQVASIDSPSLKGQQTMRIRLGQVLSLVEKGLSFSESHKEACDLPPSWVAHTDHIWWSSSRPHRELFCPILHCFSDNLHDDPSVWLTGIAGQIVSLSAFFLPAQSSTFYIFIFYF